MRPSALDSFAAGVVVPAGCPGAASISAVGLTRSALFGTRRTSVRLATTTLTVAVIPGLNVASGFGTLMIVG